MTDISIRNQNGITLDDLRRIVAETSHLDPNAVVYAKIKPKVYWSHDPVCVALTVTNADDQ